MNVKDVVELDIDGSGMDGEGVSHALGKVVFVPYTLKGERVRAVIKSVKSRYATASVIKVLEPSPCRIAPACPHYFKCGGCDMQHISPEYRREILLADLKNNLKKIAGVDCSPSEFISREGRRNKLSMPFGMRGGKPVLGLYKQGTHDVEPVECLYSGELSRAVASAVISFAQKHALSVYDGKGSGLLRHLVVREIGGRAQATLVVNGSGLGGALERELAAALPGSVDLFICPNTRNNNVILGDTVRLIKGNPRLAVDVLGVRAELSPLSFFQVNDGIRDELYRAAISELTSPVLIDLYSGIGITSNLAASRAEVYAVEVVPQAVDDANGTARLNGNAERIHNYCGTAESVLPRIAEQAGECDVLVDPPRKGCGPSVMAAIEKLAPNKLIYISCENATMCRDIKSILASGKYSLDSVKLYDMFPGTHHCETLICMSKK